MEKLKSLRPYIISMLVVFLMIFQSRDIYAFHERGALICDNCHSMHNAATGENAVSVSLSAPQDNLNELCLKCHDDRPEDATKSPTIFSPYGRDETYFSGGNFTGAGEQGENGHFRISGGRLLPDNIPDSAPGSNGTVRSADLTCWSCHDPHNSAKEANDFRLLRLRPKNGTTKETYVMEDIQVSAKGAKLTEETGVNHTVYYSGVSRWCSACHSKPDGSGNGFNGAAKNDPDVGRNGCWTRHPTDTAFSDDYVSEYNAADDAVTSDWEVPFEDNGKDWSPDAPNHQVTTDDRIMCLSCHRAHVGRNTDNAKHVYLADGARWSQQEKTGPSSGCNKCHNK